MAVSSIYKIVMSSLLYSSIGPIAFRRTLAGYEYNFIGTWFEMQRMILDGNMIKGDV